MATWRVPFVGFIQQYHDHRDEILGVVDRVLGGGDLILRAQLDDFERHLAAFCGAKHAIGLSNGTDALQLMAKAANLGPGDEVITVSHTFVATVAAIVHAGATPVLIDIGDDRNMDVSLIEAAITPRTKAILPVHLNGRICDMDPLMEIARRRSLVVLEDAAQCLGARYKGKQGGSFGLAGTFSFYPAKLLGAFGDGGAMITDDDQVAERVSALRNHGRMPDGEVSEWSYNNRLDNLQAALIDLRLPLLPEWNERRRAIARLYLDGLSDLEQVILPPPPVSDGPFYDVYQNYEIEVENRDALRAHLTASGIETMVTWGGRGVHMFKNLGLQRFRLPRTELLFQRVMLLPMFPELTDSHVEQVCSAIREFYHA